MDVSRSGFYDWLKRDESQRSKDDTILVQKIHQIHQENRGVYGSPRVHQVLLKQGECIGENRVARLMRSAGLQGRVVKVTRRNPGLKKFASSGKNLRLDSKAVTNTNQQWVADVTYLKIKGKWRYLAVIMDIYSRRILGWSLGITRTPDLTLTALKYALKKRSPPDGLIFHTDRGSEYTAYRYKNELLKQGMKVSVSRAGMCTDNAHMESFFHTLKAELIRGRVFREDNELRKALGSYINQFYNSKRLHSGIGYYSPIEYEQMVA